MAADSESYDAGTARLTVEPTLETGWEAKLAAELGKFPAMPVAFALPDLKKFAQDLETAWKNQGYKLPVELDPKGLDKLRNSPLRLPVVLDTSVAERDALAFRNWATKDSLHFRADIDFGDSAIKAGDWARKLELPPVPVSLDFTVARAQLEAFRKEMRQPVSIPVTARKRRGGGGGGGGDRAASGGDDIRESAAYRREYAAAEREQQRNRQQNERNRVQALREDQRASERAARQQEQGAARAEATAKREALKPENHLQAIKQSVRKSIGIDENPNLKRLVGDLSLARSGFDKVIDKAKTLAKVTAVTGLVGGVGGLLGALGGIGAVGLLGGHGLREAFQAQEAVTAEHRDPRAQMERADRIREATEQQRQANEGLLESQWKVHDASIANKLATMDLADAYKEQSRQVRDASDALIDAQLRQEGSALSVARARQRLLEVNTNPDATPLDREEAAFGLRAAIQTHSEDVKKTGDQRVDSREILARGVDGSKAVIQATQAVVDSQHGVQTALFGVESAVIRVNDAALAMHRALMPTEAEDKLQLLLNKLSPSARDFFNQIHRLAPEFHTLQQAVSNNLFAGLGESLAQLTNNQMPALKKVLGGIGSGMNTGLKDLFGDLDSMLTKLDKNGTLDKFVSSVGSIMTGLAPLITDIVQALIQMTAAGGPGLGELFQSIGGVLVALAPTLGQLAGSLGHDLAQALPKALPGLETLANLLLKLVDKIGPQLPTMADDFSKLVGSLDRLFRSAEPLLKPLGRLVDELLPRLPEVMNPLIGPITQVADAFGQVFTWVDKLVTRISDFGNAVSGGALGWLGDKLFGSTVVPGAAVPMPGGSVVGSSGGWAGGGPITGPGTGTSDSIPIMASNGEFVVNAHATAKHRGLLEAVNSGRYASGGLIGDLSLGHDLTAGKPLRLLDRAVKGFATGGIIQAGATTDPSNNASGGPVNALQWVLSNAKTPYVWGGTSSAGADCSGWVGDAQQVAEGNTAPSGRIGGAGNGLTGNVMDGTWPGFVRGAGANDLFVIGANAEHMVASILGVPIEERQSGETARVGSAAASPFSSQFTVLGHVDPSRFAPPYKAAAGDTTWGASGAGSGADTSADSDSGNSATSGGGNDNALMNQAVTANNNLPKTWSDLAGTTVTKGLLGLINGPGPQLPALTGVNSTDQSTADNTGTGTTPAPPPVYAPTVTTGNTSVGRGVTAAQAQSDAATKTLNAPVVQTGLLGGIQSALTGAAKASGGGSGWANFLFGPGSTFTGDPLADQGYGGGAMGAIAPGLSGLAKAAGSFVSGEVGDALHVFGVPDQLPGAVTVGLQLYNDIQGMQTAHQMSGDPSTTKLTGIAPKPGTVPAAPGGAAAGGAGWMKSEPTGKGPHGTWHGGSGGQLLSQLGYLPGGGSGVDAYASTFGASPDLVATVKQQAAAYGWGSGAQWDALDQIIGHESSWNPFASAEPASDAYGLGQFLSTTWATVGGSKTSDPGTQAMLMDRYIAQRYTNPLNAWNFWQAQSPHWYSGGGPVSGDGSGTSDSNLAWVSDGEFVVNARSAAANMPLLHAINNDANAVNAVNRTPVFPTRDLVAAGGARHVDNSVTYNVHAHDVDSAVAKMRVLEAQRAAKANTYTARWRGQV